jgi:hypothetical protein
MPSGWEYGTPLDPIFHQRRSQLAFGVYYDLFRRLAPRVEGIVDDLRLHVSKLSKIYERMIMTTPIIMSGVLTPSLSAVATMAVPSNWHCGEFYAGTMVLELLQL